MIDQELLAEMQVNLGCSPDEIVWDGSFHRFATNEKPSDKSGWYVAFPDEPYSASFGDWRSGVRGQWCYRTSDKLSDKDRALLAARIKAARAANKSARAKAYEEAAKAANALWQSLPDYDPLIHDLLYAKRKLIQLPPLVRVGEGGSIVVPVRSVGGEIQSLQTIHPGGRKDFFSGGLVKGGFFLISAKDGEPWTADSTAYVVEGLATGCTIHCATGSTVLVAFTSWNLEPVAAMAARAGLNVTICADDDWQAKDGNPGIKAATEAAEKTGASIVWPEWEGDRPEKSTDFNDLFIDEGLEAVQAILLGQAADEATSSAPPATALSPLPTPTRITATPVLASANEPSPVDKVGILVERYRSQWAYSDALGWLRWNGCHWQTFPGDEGINTLLGTLVLEMNSAGWTRQPDSLFTAIKRAFKAPGAGLGIRNADLNASDKIAFRNGTYHVKDNQFRPSLPDDCLTHARPYDWDAAAACPNWLKFLEEATDGDEGLQQLIQAVFRWALHPRDPNEATPVEKLVVLHGRKGTGKSTCLDALTMVLGHQSIGNAAPHVFENARSVAALLGKPVGICGDASTFTPNVGLLASVVSNEPIGIDVKFKTPTFARLGTFLIWAANDIPVFPRNGSEAMDRRLLPIPFKVPPRERDVQLKSKLSAEASGIFQWAWAMGEEEAIAALNSANAVEAVSEHAIDLWLERNVVAAWLLDRFSTGTDGWVNSSKLYQNFSTYCREDQGLRDVLSLPQFGRELKKQGAFVSCRKVSTIQYLIHPFTQADLVAHLEGSLSMIQPKASLASQSLPTEKPLPGANLDTREPREALLKSSSKIDIEREGVGVEKIYGAQCEIGLPIVPDLLLNNLALSGPAMPNELSQGDCLDGSGDLPPLAASFSELKHGQVVLVEVGDQWWEEGRIQQIKPWLATIELCNGRTVTASTPTKLRAMTDG